MTLEQLLRQCNQEPQEVLLTLRQVATLSDTPLSTVKRWVYDDEVLPIVRIGPYQRPRVRWSVFVKVFRPDSFGVAVPTSVTERSA